LREEEKRREGEIEEMGGKVAGSCRLIEEVTMLQLGKVPFPSAHAPSILKEKQSDRI
jgi:hypothetical protein